MRRQANGNVIDGPIICHDPYFSMQRRLHRENLLAYMINNRENLENYPIYSVDTDMVSSMPFNKARPQKDEPGESNNGTSESNY